MARRLAALWCAVSLMTCTPATQTRPGEPKPPAAPVSYTPTAADAPDGFQLRITEGQAASAAGAAVPVVNATRLDDHATDAMLARLPELDSVEPTPFAFRARSIPAPRTGDTIAEPFPPAAAPAAPDSRAVGPLEVLRGAPEGDVAIAPQISVQGTGAPR